MIAPVQIPRKKPAAEVKAVEAPIAPSLPQGTTPRPVAAVLAPMAPEERDSFSVTALADVTDRSLHAAVARFTGGLSPAALGAAYLDWATHLANAPGKRPQLVDKATRKAMRFANYAYRCAREGGTAEGVYVLQQ